MSTVIHDTVSPESGAKTHALVVYILLILGLFTAIPMLLGAVWAMLKRKDAKGTIYHSHYTNAIRVFWWTVFWSIIGAMLTLVAIGYLVLCLIWAWAFYRLVFGLAKITSELAYPL